MLAYIKVANISYEISQEGTPKYSFRSTLERAGRSVVRLPSQPVDRSKGQNKKETSEEVKMKKKNHQTERRN